MSKKVKIWLLQTSMCRPESAHMHAHALACGDCDGDNYGRYRFIMYYIYGFLASTETNFTH